MQKTDTCVHAVVTCSYVCTSRVNPSYTHMHGLLSEWSVSGWIWSKASMLCFVHYVCGCLSLQKAWECKRPSRPAPLGSCDCAKAEHCVQRAAALRKSLLLQTGSCVPEPRFLKKKESEFRENWCWIKTVKQKDSGMWFMLGILFSPLLLDYCGLLSMNFLTLGLSLFAAGNVLR